MDGSVEENIVFAREGLSLGQYVYSAEICKTILLEEPGCVDARKTLQMASKKIGDERGLWGRMGVCLYSWVFLLGACGWRKKRMQLVKESLYWYPRNKIGLLLLAHCALEKGYSETVLFIYEELHLLFPKDMSISLALGNAYFSFGDYKSALRLGEKLLAVDPSNTEAMSIVEAASLAQMRGYGDSKV